MKFFCLFIAAVLSVSAYCQTEIKLEEATSHIGDSVKIKAKVYGIKQLTNAKGAPTFISLGAAYPNQLLTIVIWQDVKEKMGFNPAQEKYVGGMAVVTGKIELYKGKPQIVITTFLQFDILYDEEVK